MKSRRSDVSIRLLPVVALINGALWYNAPTIDSTRYLLASLMLWLSVYPTWRYFQQGTREIPFFPAMTIFYFVCYGLPAFQRRMAVGRVHIAEQQVEETLTLAVAGLALLLISFYTFHPRGFTARLAPPIDLPRFRKPLILLTLVFELIRSQLEFMEVGGGVAQLAIFINFLPVVLSGALLLLALRGQLGRMGTAVLLVVIVVHVLIDFSTGSVAPAALSLVTLLFLYVAERGRVPVLTVAVIGVLMVIGLGTKQTYRIALSRGTASQAHERVETLGNVVSRSFSTGEIEKAGEISSSRTDHLSAFAYVMMKTPEEVPYWGGDTYQTLLFTFIPRAIWPDKPKKNLGQDYGHRYSFIGSYDRNTSINLEQTVELYANFGTFGVILGMMVFGVIYRLLYSLLNRPDAGDGALLIAAGTFRILLNIESDFSLVFGGILQNAVLLYLIFRFLARTFGRAPVPAR